MSSVSHLNADGQLAEQKNYSGHQRRIGSILVIPRQYYIPTQPEPQKKKKSVAFTDQRIFSVLT